MTTTNRKAKNALKKYLEIEETWIRDTLETMAKRVAELHNDYNVPLDDAVAIVASVYYAVCNEFGG